MLDTIIPNTSQNWLIIPNPNSLITMITTKMIIIKTAMATLYPNTLLKADLSTYLSPCKGMSSTFALATAAVTIVMNARTCRGLTTYGSELSSLTHIPVLKTISKIPCGKLKIPSGCSSGYWNLKAGLVSVTIGTGGGEE